jgi:putative Holliday junction resolvase
MVSGRILSIDYGRKRVGIAVSDPGRIIANGLKTVPSGQIWTFLDDYLSRENVTQFVVGFPKKLNNDPSEAVEFVNPFISKLRKKYKTIPVELVDERFTSKLARRTMIDGGLKKKDRQDKALVNTISATIILQSFLDQQSFQNKRNNQ